VSRRTVVPVRRAALTTAAAAAALLVAGAPAQAKMTPLAVSPAADTPAVSPDTQISILGAPRKAIRSVTVTGATSGAHKGRLRPYSHARGASFVLDTPLTEGEQVQLRVRVTGRPEVKRSFTVAVAGKTPPFLNIKATKPDVLEKFVTRPDLIAPKITVHKSTPKASASGNIFLTPLPSPVVHPESNNAVTIKPIGPGGPMIIDRNGQLVWFQKLTPPVVAANLRIQRYDGKRVLTWWQGPVTATAFGLGAGIIADTRYRTIKTVEAGNGYKMDIHEFTLTPEGDALFTIYVPIRIHVPGTPAGTTTAMMDAIVQEVDIKTGLVVWEWHALGHIPLSESYANPENSASYDAYHINSVQSLDGGRRVVFSARDTSAVYKVDRGTGKILWRLGGKNSDFRLGPGARFWFQHDAQELPGNRVSVFDDEAGPPQKAPASRGLVLKLDPKRKTAKVLHQYHRAPDTSAQSEGSVQQLASGNVFVGFGSTEFFSEFSTSGKLLFDASLPNGDGSYRVYRFPWSATPRTKPDVAVRANGAGVSVYASWNGATTVRRWQVLAGPSEGNLSPVTTVARTGFETRVNLDTTTLAYAVRALGADGKVLSTSPVVAGP